MNVYLVWSHRATRLLFALALLMPLLLGLAPAASAQGSTPLRVVAWGEDQYGRVSNHPTDANYIAIAGGYQHSLALRSDGTVVAWGDDEYGQVSGRPTDAGYTAIAAGYHHSLAIGSGGTVVAWGDDEYGQVSGHPTDAGYTAISAGDYHSLALRSDGTVVAWGRDGSGQVSDRPTDANYIAIEAGGSHSLALRSDGTVVAWGRDASGEVSNHPTDANYIAIAAGGNHSLALRSDGTVVAWGNDNDRQVSDRPADAGYTAIAAGYADNLALKRDGTVVTWGRNRDGSQTVPSGLNNVVAIARGYDYSLALVGELDTTPPVIAPTISGTLNNGWYTSDVQLSWNVSDQESAIASTSGCEPQSITTDTSGLTFTCSATSAGGSASQSATIQRDATAPSVSYSGNAGTYTIDQTVTLTCAATDTLSGIASSTCANISGPAYTFALGTNTRSASATDNAGNTGSGSTTFTVGVTFDSLCTLSTSFSTSPSVDKGLCDKLAAAKAAAGNTKTKNNNLNAYRQQVSAQSGKALTKQQATILTNLSKAL